MTSRFILNADDYGLAAGVSRAIGELAHARRISSTSAIVTLPRWREDAAALRDLRDRVAIGLHLNLTLGAPLGPMPELAPDRNFPSLRGLVSAIANKRAVQTELEYEIERQMDAFEARIGALPDLIDGHHHAHALPVVRDALFAAIARRGGLAKTLLRDPFDHVWNIVRRGRAIAKAMAVARLAKGFGREARERGFMVTDGFSGFSSFGAGIVDVRRDFAAALRAPGSCPVIMCHPGFVDDELAALDRLTTRRAAEFQILKGDDDFAAQVWRPRRDDNGRIAWPDRLNAGAVE